MKIIKATYGGQDCTDILQAKIISNKLVIRVNNDIIGDPSVGNVKYLEIEWNYKIKNLQIYDYKFKLIIFYNVNVFIVKN